MIKHSLALLFLGACVMPQSSLPGGAMEAQNLLERSVVVPETYEAWLDTLSDLSREKSQSLQFEFHGKVVVAVPQKKVDMEIQLEGLMEYADFRHFRERVDLHLDFGTLGPEFPAEPIALTLLSTADGKTLFVEPLFHEDWLLETMQSTNMGIEKMTFTLDLDLLEKMLQVYWDFLEESQINLASLLPEGVGLEEIFSQGFNPAFWARTYLLTADIQDFQVDSNEVHITAKLKDEWTQKFIVQQSPYSASMMEGLHYVMSFDRFSGMPTSMNMVMNMAELMQMEMSIDFQDFVIEKDLFPQGYFQHGSMEGRTLFPVDAFIQMALGSMQGQMQEDDDVPF